MGAPPIAAGNNDHGRQCGSGGEVVEEASRSPDVVGVRRMFDLMAREPRLSATAIQTVGAKGWDGFALAIVN
jgi:hypothetical protein